ncbi:MAG: copper resistance protein CopC [Dehalococcoidia bacterium]
MIRLLALAALLGISAVGLYPRNAAAHAAFITASPGPDAQIDAMPPELRVVFSEAVFRSGTEVIVTDAAGTVVSGDVAIDNNIVTVPLQPGATGAYEVRWRNVSADDGHEASGSYTFQFSPPAIGSATPESEGPA